jgi:hypothetical protein
MEEAVSVTREEAARADAEVKGSEGRSLKTP